MHAIGKPHGQTVAKLDVVTKNVIKYGKMTKDKTGWLFEAAGVFKHEKKAVEVVWRLVLSVTDKAIWHWGIF